jgi:hypothetical protein
LFRRCAISRPATTLCLQLQEGIYIAAEEAISLLIACPLGIIMDLENKNIRNLSLACTSSPQTNPTPDSQVRAPSSAPRACSRQSNCVPRAHVGIGAAVAARHNTDRAEMPAADRRICMAAMGVGCLAFVLEAAAHGTSQNPYRAAALGGTMAARLHVWASAAPWSALGDVPAGNCHTS